MELQPVAHSDTDGDTDISRNTIGLKAIIIDLEKYMTVSNAESYPGVLLFIDHSGKQKSVDPVFIVSSNIHCITTLVFILRFLRRTNARPT